MDTKILEFCNKYKEKKENDEYIKNNPEPPKVYNDSRARIQFTIAVIEHIPAMFGGNCPNTLFALDDEDLEYLYNKYSKRLQDEMNQNIEEIKEKYKND